MSVERTIFPEFASDVVLGITLPYCMLGSNSKSSPLTSLIFCFSSSVKLPESLSKIIFIPVSFLTSLELSESINVLELIFCTCISFTNGLQKSSNESNSAIGNDVDAFSSSSRFLIPLNFKNLSR